MIPLLLGRHTRQIRPGIRSSTALGLEPNLDPVLAHHPVIPRVAILKVGEECDGALEFGQLGLRDWVETGVVEGGDDGVFGEAFGKGGLGGKGADAAAEVVLVAAVAAAMVAGLHIPGDEEGVLCVWVCDEVAGSAGSAGCGGGVGGGG